MKGNKALEVDAFDRANEQMLEAGKLTSLDNQIDTTTGTVKFRANFPNKNLVLFPNQFVNARLLERTLTKATLVPTAAVQHNGTAAFVYIVNPNNTVGAQPVTVVTSNEKVTAVTGVDANVTVATSGFDRLENGAHVTGAPRASAKTSPTTPRRAWVRTGGSTAQMSPSRPFILRPVATALLMAAIFLAGGVAYFQLPVSALPEVDYPTIEVQTFYPGASPGRGGVGGDGAAGAAVRAGSGTEPDDVDELGRVVDHRDAVSAEPEYRYRRAGGAGGDQCGAELSAGESAGAAGVQQVESGGCAGADAGAAVFDDAAVEGGGSGGHAVCRRRSRRSRASGW